MLGESPPEGSDGHSTTGVPGSVATEATDGDKNAGPQEGKDLTSNSWWDAVHGITPEKLDHLITAINEMNELFGMYKEIFSFDIFEKKKCFLFITIFSHF